MAIGAWISGRLGSSPDTHERIDRPPLGTARGEGQRLLTMRDIAFAAVRARDCAMPYETKYRLFLIFASENGEKIHRKEGKRETQRTERDGTSTWKGALLSQSVGVPANQLGVRDAMNDNDWVMDIRTTRLDYGGCAMLEKCWKTDSVKEALRNWLVHIAIIVFSSSRKLGHSGNICLLYTRTAWRRWRYRNFLLSFIAAWSRSFRFFMISEMNPALVTKLFITFTLFQ